MEAIEEKALRSMQVAIVKMLNPMDNVLRYLLDRGHITDIMYDGISACEPRPEQSRKLLDEVIRKELWYEFVEALEYKGSHRKLAELVRNEFKKLGRCHAGVVYPGNVSSTQTPGSMHLGRSEEESGPYARGITEVMDSLQMPMFKTPQKAEIRDTKQKTLRGISFRLRELSDEGDSGKDKFLYYTTQLEKNFSSDPDISFERLYAIGANSRIHNQEVSLSDLDEMERLVASMAHSELGSMRFLARKGSTLGRMGRVLDGLNYVELAKSKYPFFEPGLETGNVMYIYLDLLMKAYRTWPSSVLKQKIEDTVHESINVHFENTPPEMRFKFRKSLFTKLALTLLGIGVHGNLLTCEVTEKDLIKAQLYLRHAELIPVHKDKRRLMFLSLAKSVLARFRQQHAEAERNATEAENLARAACFPTELHSIGKLKEILSLESNESLVENMDWETSF